MKFLYPQFLYALFTLIIPIIIHLFSFRKYKKVYFSNVNFLRELQQSHRSKSNLKHLLILINRMLAIFFLVLAFAQPYLPVDPSYTYDNTVSSSVFIDNSFSADNTSDKGTLLRIEREIGLQLIKQLPKTVDHQLLTNDFYGEAQHLYSNAELEKKISHIEISPYAQPLHKIQKRQSTAFSQNKYTSFIISDFQKSQFDFTQIDQDTSIHYTLIPVSPTSSNNISIDSLWFPNRIHHVDQKDQVRIQITNHGDQKIEGVHLSLKIDDNQSGFHIISLPALATLDTQIYFNSDRAGWHTGEVYIDDYPVTFDNSLYFNYHIRESINVLSLTHNPENPDQGSIAHAFATEPYFHFNSILALSTDISDMLKHTDLLIINELTSYSIGFISTVSEFVENGGTMIIIPSKTNENTSLNNLLQTLSIDSLGIQKWDSVASMP